MKHGSTRNKANNGRALYRSPLAQGFRGHAADSLYYALNGFMGFPLGVTRMFPAAFLPFVEKSPIGFMARPIVGGFLAPESLVSLFGEVAVEQCGGGLLFSMAVDLTSGVFLGWVWRV